MDKKPVSDVKKTCQNVIMIKCSKSSFIGGKLTPIIVCDFKHDCAKFSAVCVPDIAASKTCVTVCIIAKAGLCKHVLPTDDRVSLIHVDGCEYNVLGYIDLECSVVGGKTMFQALVVDNMLDDVLLSWSDLVIM